LIVNGYLLPLDLLFLVKVQKQGVYFKFTN